MKGGFPSNIIYIYIFLMFAGFFKKELLLSSGEINDEHQSPRGPSASAQLAAELLTHRCVAAD